ncbi:hypothetical protein [Nocardiopsis sp. HUAS JQ3]|nr:hypothetical protein [Nocardiopsis sp. HUAS JQ3]WDZ90819.1 hypothetical protein PV789_28755 [Nocardiopsis sp. HUAS JQ3]
MPNWSGNAILFGRLVKEPVTVFTSDKDDMDQLCGDRVVVFKL